MLSHCLSYHPQDVGEATAGLDLEPIVSLHSREHAQRLIVILSEREIADVNKQLETLSHTLRALVESSKHKPAADGHHRQQRSSLDDGLPTPSHDSQTGIEGSFEGESSFSTQPRQASQAFEATVREPPHEAGDEAVSAAVSTLQTLLEERGFSQLPSPSSTPQAQETVHHPELAQLPSPPTHVVLKVLKVARSMATCPETIARADVLSSTTAEILQRVSRHRPCFLCRVLSEGLLSYRGILHRHLHHRQRGPLPTLP